MIPYGCEVCPECGEVVCELCAAEPHNVHLHGDHGVTLRLSEREAGWLLRRLVLRRRGHEGAVAERLGDALAYWLESTAGGEGGLSS